ncbi:hypothetical protein Tco_1017562 [Tanacetum coccineum]|uniref:Uncharacterized protein n=1 Tax=Tanacetum coccineum TaxID=301880 RepID=A0ABQ5FUE7_9ASTR
MHNDIMAAGSKERPPMLDQEDMLTEAIHIILSGIEDDIYSTVDTCTTAKEMWIAIERLQQDLDTISYHKLFDILKQYHNEVNEFHAEKIARNANPLAFVAATQQYPADHYQAPKPHKPYAPSLKPTLKTRSHTPTRNKGKEIAKPITSPYKSASKEEEDSDLEQAQGDKDIEKNLALIAKYIKNIYKPTNNNLKTSSNTRNKNVNTSTKIGNNS